MKNNALFIFETLDKMFPNAKCELNYKTDFQLCVAVCLSAQTTDNAVNAVTIELFKKYPDAYSLANANINDVSDIIHSLGLYNNKSKNIILLAKCIVEQYNGVVPKSIEELVSLPGIGRKSANVIVSNCFNIPAIAVDTHVNRVSKRLNLADENDSILEVENKLMKLFPKDKWSKLHHLLIFFGRYYCTSRNPNCNRCPFIDNCAYKKSCNK